MLLASVIGGYTLIGGLGATFYVSYFNTALIFVLILMLVVEVFYNPSDNPENPFGGAGILYDYISCWKAPNGNRDESYLTFYSPGNYLATLLKMTLLFTFLKMFLKVASFLALSTLSEILALCFVIKPIGKVL